MGDISDSDSSMFSVNASIHSFIDSFMRILMMIVHHGVIDSLFRWPGDLQ